jgi:N6-adenosine-specific RNA methylase IME4
MASRCISVPTALSATSSTGGFHSAIRGSGWLNSKPEKLMFEQIVIDPPWPQRKILRKVRPNQKLELDYPTMPARETFELLDREVLPLATPAHNVWLWTIDKFLTESEELMRERGYKLHVRLIWDKTNGVAPNMTVRFSHEYLEWWYKPPLQKIALNQRGKFTTVIRAKGRQHSRKPDEAYAMIGSLYPESSCLDVFSREEREGWTTWGNQTGHFG